METNDKNWFWYCLKHADSYRTEYNRRGGSEHCKMMIRQWLECAVGIHWLDKYITPQQAQKARLDALTAPWTAAELCENYS